MKKQLIAALVSSLVLGQAYACTTILVGNQASADGSFIAARNEDYAANNAKHMVIHPAAHNQKGMFKAHGNDFTYPLPKEALEYTAIHDYDTNDQSMGEMGFNAAGVGITATETIYNGSKALKIDPYLEKTGITEDSIQTVILPRIHTAREGVELLGKIIEEKGAGEGFGVAFVDKQDLWYLETGSGHQWMATRLPADKYFVSANQGRLRLYNPKDTANYLGSPNLIQFAIEHGLYQPKDGAFDFHKAYSDETKTDVVYNYPRVWTLQHMFNPELDTKLSDPLSFPVFLAPKNKITIAQVETALRNHYQGTKHDPYVSGKAMNDNPDNYWRPVSVFRTQESHILQVRPNLPKAIGEVEYVAFGMSDLSVYLPYYQGVKQYLPGYDKGSNEASDDSVAWKYRKLQTLVMQDYNAYAPAVQAAYAKFEAQTAKDQAAMEKQYLAIYKKQPAKAQALLQNFENKVMTDGLKLTDQLTNQVFTKLTNAVDKKYHFTGA